MDYVVLDPACGSGNFLYVAYREIRRLELRLRERLAELRSAEGMAPQEELEFFPISNMKGLEVEVFAAELARVTLWMGHKLAAEEMREHGLSEPTLPLVDLSGIRRAHALRVEWPEADAIVGNPPYHGSNTLRAEVGDEEIQFLQGAFGIGIKDYSVYWFRKAHQRLKPGGRAGLVATNSVTQNRNRKPSLEWIVGNGGVIVDAVSKQDWTGDAVVNVSIVNWVKEPPVAPQAVRLDGREVEAIAPSLVAVDGDVSSARRLQANKGCAFQGPIPVGEGFVIQADEARALLELDSDYSLVVRPYLTSQDIAEDPEQRPTRWVIDFGTRSLEEAERWPSALQLIRERVKPVRERNRDRRFREKWWLFGRPRVAMRKALAGLDRYVAGTRHGVRLHFCWCEPSTMASDATNVFAFSDDYSMGVLCSGLHANWAWAQSSTIREDIRYTPTSAFETFPWPEPSPAARGAVEGSCRDYLQRRSLICLDRGIGLTKLDHETSEGLHPELVQLKRDLDCAVVAAYGWPESLAEEGEQSNLRLADLNAAIAAGEIKYAGPGG